MSPVAKKHERDRTDFSPRNQHRGKHDVIRTSRGFQLRRVTEKVRHHCDVVLQSMASVQADVLARSCDEYDKLRERNREIKNSKTFAVSLYSRGGELIYYHGPHELCIITGGPQNQLILS